MEIRTPGPKTVEFPSTRHSLVERVNWFRLRVTRSAGAVTVTVSVVGDVPTAPVAVSSNVSGAFVVSVTSSFGNVNVGLAVFAPVIVTGAPAVCLHENVLAAVDPDPSSVTAAPCAAVWSGPAFAPALGVEPGARTTTSTVLVGDEQSAEVTFSSKVSVTEPVVTAG